MTRPALALLLAALLLPGCYFGRAYRHAEIDPADVRAIKPGKTTRGEILDRFGPPHAVVGPVATREKRSASAAAARGDAMPEPLRPPGTVSSKTAKFDAESETSGVDYLRAQGYRYVFDRQNLFANFLFLLFWSEVDQKSDELLVLFDADDRVKHAAYRADTPRLRAAGFWFGEGDPD